MKKTYLFTAIMAVICFLPSCFLDNEKTAAASTGTSTAGHPSWIMQGNIYEVNVRQYTAEGTFKAFEKHLDRLKDMGVQTLWFMPINPISVKDRKGVMGSYYAVSNYKAVNPEFGTLDDWKALVKKSHEMGFKVIIDWVPNHTGADHYWVNTNPEFFEHDSTGAIAHPHDWMDVLKLNYRVKAMNDSMYDCLKFWITETDIDGFRCDVAEDVPRSFWSRAITDLKKVKPGIFFLAEGSQPWLHDAGFDATYAWDAWDQMVKIVKGERNVLSLDSSVNKLSYTYPDNAIRMYFTSNHDKNSWEKADYGTMPGPTHAPFAVFTQTIARSVPLVYSGQEEPVLDSISFFYKNTINFSKFARAAFYKTLLNLRKENPALAADASFRKISVGNDKAVYAYVREAGKRKVLTILNLSNEPQTISIADKDLQGDAKNVFSGKQEKIDGKQVMLGPWLYLVYSY